MSISMSQTKLGKPWFSCFISRFSMIFSQRNLLSFLLQSLRFPGASAHPVGYQPGRHCQLLPLSLRHLHRAGWWTFLAFKQGIDVYIVSSSVGWIDTDTHICMCIFSVNISQSTFISINLSNDFQSICLPLCLRSVENVGMSRSLNRSVFCERSQVTLPDGRQVTIPGASLLDSQAAPRQLSDVMRITVGELGGCERPGMINWV